MGLFIYLSMKITIHSTMKICLYGNSAGQPRAVSNRVLCGVFLKVNVDIFRKGSLKHFTDVSLQN
uniref:Uncharacterized protein n=1 Tax=Anguilla anguilla TaxID=7936 RepID=A0A0E9U0E2_ANGAN